jgi:hypothetical protein
MKFARAAKSKGETRRREGGGGVRSSAGGVGRDVRGIPEACVRSAKGLSSILLVRRADNECPSCSHET